MLRAYRTPRLLLRAWDPADAAARKAAVDGALDALRPWFPWAAEDPRPVSAHRALLAAHRADFAAGRWWGYGVWLTADTGASRPASNVLGSGHARGDRRDRGRRAGVGPRRAPRPALVGALGLYRGRAAGARDGVREISYWLAAGATGCGYATEAVGALAAAALADPAVHRLEIRVDPRNAASRRLPPRLGFTLAAHLVADRTDADGRPLDTLVWAWDRAPAGSGRDERPAADREE